jgi:acetate kinase
MSEPVHRVLTINGGSSTLRFALFNEGDPPHAIVRGKIERIGLPETRWKVRNLEAGTSEERVFDKANHEAAATYLLDWLDSFAAWHAIDVVAHRVVHGFRRSAPVAVTPGFLDELRGLIELDPDHLPSEIALMTAFQRRRPALLQLACFDTAFHRDMPQVARRLPIPRHFQAAGVERYGFHGLSYGYLMGELLRLGEPAATQGRVILAHLGNGASLSAVREGVAIDTSMGFTPASGIMMSTRSGDLDPGLSHYLEKTRHMGSAKFLHMVNHESGLLGVSGTSSDMRDLLAHEESDDRAAEAIAMFCYQVRKCIGAFAAALGGVDTLVFAGGIGENAPPVRERVCRELRFLGIELDDAANAQSRPLISSVSSHVRVHVIRTDEELMLAKLALAAHSRRETLRP